MNPWNLTEKQAQALDAIVEHDGSKRAARALGISEQAIGDRAKLARKQMGAKGRIRYLLLWDRWRREGERP